jgi:pilus assembly protein CpaF
VNPPQHTRWQDFQRTPLSARSSALEEMRQKMHQYVIQELGPTLYDQRTSETELRRQVHELLHKAISEERAALTSVERTRLIQDVSDDVLGYGPIDRFLKDPSITEVMVNGPSGVFIERAGRIEATNISFADETHLRRIIDKIVSQVGRRVDEATPMVDARLPDGSRVNVVVPPLAIGGPFLTIRKFSVDPYTVDDLISFGTLSPQVARFVDACVRGRLNVVISGGTGTGKTTLLNVLSSFIPSDERIVTVEDAKELQLHQQHVLPLESRPANIEGKGEVRIRDLVRNALRMRPDRIVVGEVRGAETLDMLQAMNTGHEGSITTVHANTPRDALARIETMTLMAGMELPMRAIREQMSSALDVVIHLARLRDGSRRVTHVSEVLGMEGDVITLQDLYLFDYGMGVDDSGRTLGELKSTGIRPHFAERLADHGITLEPELFRQQEFARRVVGLR